MYSFKKDSEELYIWNNKKEFHMKQILFTALVLLFGMTGFAQEANYWSSVERGSVDFEEEEVPKEFEAFELDLERLKMDLGNAPVENFKRNQSSDVSAEFPVGEGKFKRFQIFDSPFFSKDLRKKYPNINSYKGIAADGTLIQFDISLNGFYSISKGTNGVWYNDVVDGFNVVYKSNALKGNPDAVCGNTHENEAEEAYETFHTTPLSNARAAANLKTYRTAVATTGEYVRDRCGGSKTVAIANINTVFNRLNLIFQTELGARFELIPGNDTLIFLNPTLDPYPLSFDDEGKPYSGVGDLLNPNRQTLNSLIGVNNFDVGHVFTAECRPPKGGPFPIGVAQLGSTCGDGKARGATCFLSNNINSVVSQIMAHEIGHQFSAAHSWNNCPFDPEIPESQRSSGSAYEPGGGSTIMSYNGTCRDQAYQNSADDYFHVHSLQQISNFITSGSGSTCGLNLSIENEIPELNLNYSDGFYIPISTPFELQAQASDTDGDQLYYCWEQYNRNNRMTTIQDPMGNAPTFRSFEPDTFQTRIFPRLFRILSGTSGFDEVLPTYSRDLNFRCTVRDLHPIAGGTVWEEVAFHVDGNTKPFKLNNLNSADTFQHTNLIPVEWDVANTNNELVNCQAIDILLSVDGGASFPYTILANTPNDGKAFALLPEFTEIQTDCRIKIKASNNIFFNINSSDFIINPSSESGFNMGLESNISTICYPEFNLIAFEVVSLGVQGFSEEVNLTIEGLPVGSIISYSKNPIQPGDTSIVTVDLNGITDLGIFNVKVVGNSNSIQNFERSTEIKILSTDFSSLNLNDPPNGASGISFGPRLEWVDVPDALLYDVEISDDPTFENNVQTRSNTTVNFYSPLQSLNPNTTYYWRVKPKNDCTDGQFTAPNAFRTGTFACTEYEAQDVPIFISGSGTPTRTSTISIGESGSIQDVNLKNIKGDHEIFSDLEFSLTSPAGTEVLLFSNKCGNVGATFDFNLDDEASIAFNCSALGLGWDHRPDSSLAKFIGEDTQGDWVLTMKDLRATASGGVDSWTVEFCAPLSTEKPNLATNLIFPVQKNGTRRISNEFLNITDNSFSASELEYTLVVNTQEGSLFLNNNPINVGQTFTQSDIDNGNLKYGHNGGDIDNDYFTFVVVNPDGGFFGTPNFEISISEDVSTSTEELASSDLIILYPNPASDLINLRFEGVKQEDIEVFIYNIQGKTLYQSILPANREIQITTRGFASGIYIAKVRRGDEIIVKRFKVIN